MPARLSQLATLFEDIIFNYYGVRPKVSTFTPASEQIDSDEYIQIDLDAFNMEDFIRACAAKKTGCDRGPLMSYLAYGMTLINTTLANSKPLSEEATSDLTQQLTQLIVNLHSLLNVSKTMQITVKKNSDNVMLYGCHGCASGYLIQNVLFSTIPHAEKECQEYITDLINAHQNPLLMQENQRITNENQRITNELLKQSNAYQALILKHRVELETMKNMNIEGRKYPRSIIKPPITQQPIQGDNRNLEIQEQKQVKFSLFSKTIEELFDNKNVDNPSDWASKNMT